MTKNLGFNGWMVFTFFLIHLSPNLLLQANADAEKLYIQSAKAELKTEPKLGASAVTSLKRGDELMVLKTEGLWFQVSAGGKTGWVSKLFVNSHKPVGEAQLTAELSNDNNLDKAARRRSSSYSVSAATRGLSAGNRARDGREKYESDYSAIDQLDKLKIEQNEVRKFKDDAKLGE